MIVPSSTSSSSVPAGGTGPRFWASSWALALALVVLGAGAWELHWRRQGFAPALNDDTGLWVLARQSAAGMGPDGAVVVGSSRIQTDINRDFLIATTGWTPIVQLATNRGTSIQVLESLADDPSFRGNVLCEINPMLHYAETVHDDRLMLERIAAYDRAGFGHGVEQRLRMAVQGALASRLPDVSLATLWRRHLEERPVRPRTGHRIDSGRFRYRDDALAITHNRSRQKQFKTGSPKLYSRQAFEERVHALAEMAQRIRDRGGQVIFLRLPTSGFVRRYEHRWTPRETWWNVLAEGVGSPSIHFEDHPSLDSFTPRDHSHLGEPAAARFTRVLGKILVARSLAPGPQRPGTAKATSHSPTRFAGAAGGRDEAPRRPPSSPRARHSGPRPML
jgi:hypothetical protein